jgi:hypothetical protein
VLYEWTITFLFLLLAVIMHRIAALKIYWKIASAPFHASAGTAIIFFSVGNFTKYFFHAGYDLLTIVPLLVSP